MENLHLIQTLNCQTQIHSEHNNSHCCHKQTIRYPASLSWSNTEKVLLNGLVLKVGCWVRRKHDDDVSDSQTVGFNFSVRGWKVCMTALRLQKWLMLKSDLKEDSLASLDNQSFLQTIKGSSQAILDSRWSPSTPLLHCSFLQQTPLKYSMRWTKD